MKNPAEAGFEMGREGRYLAGPMNSPKRVRLPSSPHFEKPNQIVSWLITATENNMRKSIGLTIVSRIHICENSYDTYFLVYGHKPLDILPISHYE